MLQQIFGAGSPSEQFDYVPEALKEVILLGGESFSNEAFLDCKYIESITISKTITSIGTNAFHNCSSLKNIMIPDTVTSIEEYAFSIC